MEGDLEHSHGSDSDDECTLKMKYEMLNLNEKNKVKYIIKINHPYRVRWDVIIMIFSIWNSITSPIEIAFKPEEFARTDMVIINYAIDILFLIDILLNFRTSYTNALTGDEILDPKMIAS